MNSTIIQKAATQFGNGTPVIETIGDAPAQHSFKVTFAGESQAIVLQCISQRTFGQPENFIQNYQLLYEYLENKPGAVKIPALVPTLQNKLFWIDQDDNFWKATRFIDNAYSIAAVGNERDACHAARAFAALTCTLSGFNPADLYDLVPEYHNLNARYQQFEEAISKGTIMRLLRSTHLISELRQRKKLVDFYNRLTNDTDYPTRLMHHDSRINNVLFDKQSGAVLCPINLDTVMPGKFFTDLGEMIRTMTCPVDENSTSWEEITIRPAYYLAIICGYLDELGHSLTPHEKENLHYSGILMIYMQVLRFVTDFLNNDIYYQTSYHEQNLNRAQNQFILLEQLEEFLEKKYEVSIYD